MSIEEQIKKDSELAEKINKEINKRITHWEEAIRILKSLVSADEFESYSAWGERMYYADGRALEFLKKVNEL